MGHGRSIAFCTESSNIGVGNSNKNPDYIIRFTSLRSVKLYCEPLQWGGIYWATHWGSNTLLILATNVIVTGFSVIHIGTFFMPYRTNYNKFRSVSNWMIFLLLPGVNEWCLMLRKVCPKDRSTLKKYKNVDDIIDIDRILYHTYHYLKMIISYFTHYIARGFYRYISPYSMIIENPA